MRNLLYKGLGLLASLLGGMLASAVVKKLWELTPGEDQAPDAADTRRSWGEILTAAALEGAIFAVIRAAIERATAAGTEKLTGEPPGDAVKRERGEKVGN
jgi:hypothetical protein